MVLRLAVLLTSFAALGRCRECGQEEIDARDITGCVTVLHMKYLGHSNAVWLGDALHHNPDLEFLDLHHTKLGDADAESLAAGLHNNTKLKRLAMHNNKLHDAGAVALGKALAHNDALEFLSLSSNGVGDIGARALADGLRANSALRRLDMYFNLVADAGAAALADALKVNSGLRALHLDTNHVGEEGALALAAALRSRSSPLGELTLMYNHCGNKGVKALAAAAAANSEVHKLDLAHDRQAHGAAIEHLASEHEPLMAERLAVAQWLVDSGLVADGWASAHGPPLRSPYAPPVAGLRAHTRDGLLALRHDDGAVLAARPELRGLGETHRGELVRVLLEEVRKVVGTAHDEL